MTENRKSTSSFVSTDQFLTDIDYENRDKVKFAFGFALSTVMLYCKYCWLVDHR